MKIFKITSIFKLIYIGVIIILLYMFYSGKEVSSYEIDGLSIVETSSIGFPLIPKKIRSLELTYKGLSFSMNPKKAVTIITYDKMSRPSHIKNLTIIDNSLQVDLENSITLVFRVDNYGERLTISSSIPKVFPNIKEVYLPFTLIDGFSMEETDISYVISNESSEFHLKVNDRYVVNKTEQVINLIAEDDKVSTLTFSQLNSDDLPIAEQWYNEYKKLESQAIEVTIPGYLAKIDNEIDNLYDPIRYIPKTETSAATWKNIPSRSNITENSFIVYLAKAMETGRYSNNLRKIQGIKQRYPSLITYSSTPFLGDVVSNGKSGMTANSKALLEIQRKINNSDKTLFQSKIPMHYFEAGDIDYNKLETMVNELEKKLLSLTELSNALYYLINILDMGAINSQTSDSVKEITDLIIQKIEWDSSGIYLVEENNESSQLLNLTTGKLLIEASQHETSIYSSPIGESLINTFINNSDDKGSVATIYNFKDKTFSAKRLLPEDNYLLLSESKYLPHYYHGSGLTIWTISDSITINKTSKETRIKVTYPTDRYTNINSHFLVISGILPYKELHFRGTAWRADKNFEKWGIGYYYEASTQLLYFMPNHSKATEEITIYY